MATEDEVERHGALQDILWRRYLEMHYEDKPNDNGEWSNKEKQVEEDLLVEKQDPKELPY